MEAAEAARLFHFWATQEGLVSDPGLAPTTNSISDFSAIQVITEDGKQLLRTKLIQAVGFNAASHEIVVFTKRAAPHSKKALKSLPERVDDVTVRYRQGTQENIGTTPPQPFGNPPFIVHTVAGSPYYACGSSISVGNWRDAGTLGCLVRDPQGTLFGLTNNHVSASCNHAGIGLPILAPGVLDVAPNSLPPFTLGFHHSALTLAPGSPDNVSATQNLDAALFRIASAGQVSSFQGNAYDTPAVASPLLPNLEVEKVGRTTGHTKGRVISQIHGPFPIGYRAELYGFSGSVYFDPVFAITGHGGLFSDFGDSGSLVTAVDDQGNRHAVGIILGGMQDGSAPGGKISLALPLEPILAQFGVSLVSSHNV